MPSENKAQITIFYSFKQEDRSVTFNLDPCDIEMERETVEVEPKNGYRCYKVTDVIVAKFKGIIVKHVEDHAV